jgi:ubiquinone/menaquinone biosynthesis C-methylase UbiE
MIADGAPVKYFTDNAEQYTTQHYEITERTSLWRRHRACLKALTTQGYGAESRVLDLGCGPGLLARDLSQAGVGGVGLDAAPGMIEICRHRHATEKWAAPWDFQVADAEALPFPDGYFDGGAAAGVIEYLPTDDKMLSEVKRVLKPGSIFILNVTNKYGYSNCLNPILNPIKAMPFIKKLASPVRRALASDSQPLATLGFEPRRHSPAVFRSTLAKHGFRVVTDQYIGFSLLPSPFCTLTSRVTGRLDSSLDVLDRTPLRYFASSYIVTVQAI